MIDIAKRRTLGVLVVIALTLIVVFITDFFLLPKHTLVAALYAIPILIAAHELPDRVVAAVIAVALALDLYSVWAKAIPLDIWPFGTFALLAIAYLGIMLARKIKLASIRAGEAEEARLRLQDFIGMVAHDLRGPLTVILGYSQMLVKSGEREGSKATKTAARSLETETRRMDRLIQDLLDASQIGSGRFQVRRQRVDLVALGRRIVAEQQITTTRHCLLLEAPERLEGELDPDRMVQVLINLVSNAIKYSPNGGDVRIIMRSTDGDVEISVIDRGLGFDPKDAGLLFQPFSRLHRDRPVKGTGLGLYITKGIVEAHGGRMWAESAGPGKGSSFTSVLPQFPASGTVSSEAS